jgi:hypothetical protein
MILKSDICILIKINNLKNHLDNKNLGLNDENKIIK